MSCRLAELNLIARPSVLISFAHRPHPNLPLLLGEGVFGGDVWRRLLIVFLHVISNVMTSIVQGFGSFPRSRGGRLGWGCAVASVAISLLHRPHPNLPMLPEEGVFHGDACLRLLNELVTRGLRETTSQQINTAKMKCSQSQ